MAAGRKEDASGAAACDERLLFVFFLIVILFFFLWEVAVFGNFLLLVLFVIIVIIGNDVQMDGMDLRDFQLGLALRTTENLAFFDFILFNADSVGPSSPPDHL